MTRKIADNTYCVRNSLTVLCPATKVVAALNKLPSVRLSHVNVYYRTLLECGPMPNLMVALPNIGGALCSTPQSLADAHY